MMAGGANKYNFAIVFAVAMGSFTYGFTNSIIAPIYGIPAFYNYFHLSLEPNDGHTAQILGALNGIFFAGGMIGCITIAMLEGIMGRVRTMQVTSIVSVISGIVQGASVHIAMYIIGRLLAGLGAGMFVCLIPIYMSEVSPPKQRGRLVGLHAVGLVSGYATSAWAGYGCAFAKNPNIQWRLLSTLQLVMPAALLLTSPWLPESPRWLVLHHKPEIALKTLRKLHHTVQDPNDVLAREEFVQIQRQIELDRSMPHTWLAMVKVPSYRKRLILALVLQFILQSTGVLVVNNFQVLLYNNLGLYGSIPLLLYGVYTTYALALNYLSTFIIDRMGRVRMITVGLLGSTTMVVLLASMIGAYSGTTNKLGNGFGVAFLFLFLTFYALLIDCTAYVYVTEIFPTHIRAKGVSACLAVFLGAAILYNEVAPTAFATIGWKYYLVFICVSYVGTAFVWFFCPETMNLSLEEVARLFGDEVALDISHMTVEEKAALDRRLVEGEGDKAILQDTPEHDEHARAETIEIAAKSV